MLQSQQCWLPVLHEPTDLIKTLQLKFDQKFIAHCIEEKNQQLSSSIITLNSSLLLIGPEGDFTLKEIELALLNNFIPVSLGKTRLRTETAGIVAAILLKMSSLS